VLAEVVVVQDKQLLEQAVLVAAGLAVLLLALPELLEL
jgi:hypothetical protein